MHPFIVFALFSATAVAQIAGYYLAIFGCGKVQPPGCFFLATASLALFASLLTPHPHAASRVYSPAVSKESRL
jgi:drug/metabolite transporter superfamily protein YnfA